MHDITETTGNSDETNAGSVVACADGSPDEDDRAVESSLTSFNCFGAFGGFGVNFRLGVQLRRAHSTTEVSASRGDESPPYSPTVQSRPTSPTSKSSGGGGRARSASVGGAASEETPSDERLMETFDEWWRRRQQVMRERRKARRLRRRHRQRTNNAWVVSSPMTSSFGEGGAGGATTVSRRKFVDMIGDDILTRRYHRGADSERRIVQEGIPARFSGTD